jgi:hypothetical protein
MKKRPNTSHIVPASLADGDYSRLLAEWTTLVKESRLEAISIADLNRVLAQRKLAGSRQEDIVIDRATWIALSEKHRKLILRAGFGALFSSSGRSTLSANSRRRLTRPPGSFMQSTAEFLCSRKSYERVAKPIIADLQFEYFEALSQGRRGKAAYIRVRGSLSFWFALGMGRIMKTVWDLWRKMRAV